mgnify:CR=1 FL=1
MHSAMGAVSASAVQIPCTYCQTNFGYDYYIQPTSPKSTYFKKGRFDDESECA